LPPSRLPGQGDETSAPDFGRKRRVHRM